MTSPLVLGIDFGTCRTSAAVLIGDTCEKVPLGYGVAHHSDMPTAVFIGKDGTILVGEQADNSRHLDPARYFGDFKRRLGSADHHEFDGTPYATEDLVATVLRFVRQAAEKEFQQGAEGSIDTAVLTVPTTYSEGGDQWVAMERAGRLAGFKSIRLVREPDAAAVYFDSLLRKGGQDLPKDGEITLVYDLGGGTFDPALIRCASDGYRILRGPDDAYGAECGGLHFDRLIQAHFAQVHPDAFAVAKRALSGLDPDIRRRDVKDALDLLRMLVEAKGVLSSKELYEGEESGGGLYRLTRNEFEGMISPLLDQTIASCEALVERCPEAEWKSIKRILMVGGSSQIPLVGKKLEKLRLAHKSSAQVCRGMIGTNKNLYYDPGLAVGYGAAVIGATAFSVKPRPVPKRKEGVEKEIPRPAKTPAAIFKNAQALATGDGVRKNLRSAHKLFLEAAEAGYLPAVVRIAEMFAEGEGCTQDFERAREWFTIAAEAGNQSALVPLGALFEKGLGGRRDLAAAFQWYMEAASKGDAAAQFLVASMWDKGRGTAKNLWEARNWYEKAAKAKNAEAMYRLGQLDEQVSDLEDALKWFTKADKFCHVKAKQAVRRIERLIASRMEAIEEDEDIAFDSDIDESEEESLPPRRRTMSDDPVEEEESPEDWYNKGEKYRTGQGTAVDFTEAAKWYRKATGKRHVKAQLQLAELLLAGNGTTQNTKAAFVLFEAAADAGDPEAQFRLGSCYQLGWGTAISMERAKYWYHQACNSGHEGANASLNRLNLQEINQNHEQKAQVLLSRSKQEKNELGDAIGFALAIALFSALPSFLLALSLRLGRFGYVSGLGVLVITVLYFSRESKYALFISILASAIAFVFGLSYQS